MGKRSRRGWGRDAREVGAREVGGEMHARLAHGRLRERFRERRVFIGGSGEHDRFPVTQANFGARERGVLGIDLIYDLMIFIFTFF